MKLQSLVQTASLLLSLGATVQGLSRSRNDACKPNNPFKPLPTSSQRSKTCRVKAHGDGTDDSPAIMSAIKKCNNGGKVVFDEDKEYTIGTALDLTFLKNIDLGIHLLDETLKARMES